MTKRSIAAVILVAAILLIPSCDAETFMRKFGTNVLGGLGGENIGKINEIIEAGVENHDELVSLIVEVSKNPDTSEKLVSSLSSEASDDSIIKVKELFSSDENISQAIDYVEDLTDEKIESLDIPQSVKQSSSRRSFISALLCCDTAASFWHRSLYLRENARNTSVHNWYGF